MSKWERFERADFIMGVSNNMVRAVNVNGETFQAGRMDYNFFNNENQIIPGPHKINPEYFMLKLEYQLKNYVNNLFCCSSNQ